MTIEMPRSDLARTAGALDAERLVTNGLGRFAAGTLSQANRRRHHALLIASLRPLVDRVAMICKADVNVENLARHHALGCNEFADGTLVPRGCVAQAWSVAQTLRAWDALSRARVSLRSRVSQVSGA
jgi:glycogen debranching enzyme-like protein